jgi:hypothetical protein
LCNSDTENHDVSGRERAAGVKSRHLYPYLVTAVFLTSAFGAYWLVRTLLEQEELDPTRKRIRALIDEADQLFRTLDEQRRS